jgi:hypothetical protein
LSDYTHEAWLATLPRRAAPLEGDAGALAAIRAETRAYHSVDDITDDAPVVLWNGLFVKGLGEMKYEVPDAAFRRYVESRPFPQDPVAVMPTETSETRREELLAASKPVEGSATALAEAINRIRLFHEVPTALFPSDGELRWFRNGIHLVGPGDDPSVFQAPMDRLADMVVPREFPSLPALRDPKPTR